ncbi:unnamed protein product [Bursaphelenchus okinawaensis]|uniref:IST1 homolog n=1 Tax=Bursaphelenchus okinawaensis TaxID=465554 RepID=A0A811LA22_9BILA|nr:unnamed protein product [Bursaphelenchus okinawaensis]CAG9119873.1 unnamed protein product [Bursaphelenchus okinawaensis]
MALKNVCRELYTNCKSKVMSVSWGTQYAKLKTNLRLCANRLKLLQKKKTEMAQKARNEIADMLMNDKADRARIRVESIIREDFVVEAYELLEMLCELLLARFGVIQQMKEIDDGIAEAVTSMLWVAPRICHEVTELKVISDQLTQKYGKQFAEAARMNQLPEPTRVAPKLVNKLSIGAPNKLLVEKYLIEIAKCAGVDFIPDAKVMREDDDEMAKAEQNLINFVNEDNNIGWNVNDPPVNLPNQMNSVVSPTNTLPAHPTPQQYYQPPPPQMPTSQVPHLPPAGYQPPNNFQPPPPPQLNSVAPDTYMAPAPSHKKSDGQEHIYESPPDASNDILYDFPEPPSDFGDDKKNGGGGKSAPGDNINFEDITQRFKRLNQK